MVDDEVAVQIEDVVLAHIGPPATGDLQNLTVVAQLAIDASDQRVRPPALCRALRLLDLCLVELGFNQRVRLN